MRGDQQQEKDPGKNNLDPSTEGEKSQPSAIDLNGAAIIDKDGREVPITESMIVDAFDEIAKSDKPQ
ncbi:MAG: PA1571 family protein [Porticoccaceae bacterium]